jgi:type IV fimbrial biogenesis protein FimT
MQNMQKTKGFTLLEVMVVLAIAAILATLAAPSLQAQIQSNTISSNVNTFMADMRFARSESIRRGGSVVMCRSDDPEAANPTCGSGSGPGSNGWVSGWIIFHDWNNNNEQGNGEPLLRVQGPITSMDSISEVGSSTRFKFTATGRQGLSGATSLRFGGDNYPETRQRKVCVSMSGRVRVAGDGLAAC